MVSCQECHKQCRADCCRMFTITKILDRGTGKVKMRGQSPDEKKYFRLHGAQIAHETIIITLSDYRITEKGEKLLLWRDCDWLDNKTLLCKNHDLKPFMCYDLNETTKSKYYVTKGCKYET